MRGVIAKNTKGFKPGDAKRLAEEIKRSLKGAPVSVRVASGHVEISARGVDEDDLKRVVREIVGDIMDVIKGGEGLADYVAFIDMERYWEAHEALEAVWSKDRDPYLQVLILAAAALAKAQEGMKEAALRIARRAEDLQRRLEYEIVDMDCLRREVERVFAGLRGMLRDCIKI
ncbi:MAG: DUF309 domain-containing protein [Desulfurococcales archaeon]|nr:DUF309 domain-containing protein [Desulfurococcales archaeon]